MQSIIQENKECFICTAKYGLHLHHVFYGSANRKLSDKYGLTVYLCGYHHNLSEHGVHYNHDLDIFLKQAAQKKFEETHSHEEFMSVFGKNYIA